MHAGVTAAMVILLGLASGAAHAAFDIPTGAAPSPLFGAQPFTQKMLQFEEFGTQALPATAPAHSLPEPGGCTGPAVPATYTTKLDTFLKQPLSPAPQRTANTSAPNPWASRISTCLGRPVKGVVEGRPPGEDFAHQRWDEFKPQRYFQTAMAGSRPNGGIRDSLQLHGYKYGEYAAGGLYNDTTGTGLKGTTKGIQIKFHPLMPVQDPKAIWTFDGTLPPKLLMAPYETTLLLRNYNALPIDDTANRGFGEHTISTHEHNGHNPAESDGFAGAFFFPGEFYDYRWPMVLAGRDTINTDKTDPRAGTPACADPRPGFCTTTGGVRKIAGNWKETMSTHWFHDHMLDATAQNVYKGNAAMMNYYSAIDRGREPATAAQASGTNGYGCHYANPANVNLCLPSGSDLDWGNRSYDINLVMADKAWDAQGQLFYNTLQTDGFLGDVATVNFQYKPYLDVRARRYRFRILNGSVARYWKVALVDSTGQQVPFHLIANDGNIMQHAIPFPNVESPEGLPQQAIAERMDIIVDFSKFKAGTKLYFVNLLEHADGKTPKQSIPLAQVLSGAYAAGGCPQTCDPLVGKFMEIRVQANKVGAVDLSMNPADYEEGKKQMIPLPGFTAAELANAKERTFSFNRGGDDKPWTISTDGGSSYNASSPSPNGQFFDPAVFNRVSAAPERNSVEIWHIKNGGQGWSHPVHIHFEEGQILQRGGKAPPIWEKYARKDMYRIGPHAESTDSVDVAIRVREFLGTYVEHCHNTTHEDNAMLLRWDSQAPGQTVAIQSPFPTWDGVSYVATNTTDVPTFKSGKQTDFLASRIDDPIANNDVASVASAATANLKVLLNDVCVGACDPASVAIGTSPAHGTVTVGADGSVNYTSEAGYSGLDAFTYTVRDTTTGSLTSNPATVALTVTGSGTTALAASATTTTAKTAATTTTLAAAAPAATASVGAAPVAMNDAIDTVEVSVVGINPVANDENCAACTVTIVSAPLHGTVVANQPAAGQVTYTPAPGFTGADSFTYTATNAAGTSAPASVSVNVAPNPVTDIVTISGASLLDGNLQAAGTVTALNAAFASTVQAYAGGSNAAGTACTGTALGSVPVNAQGGWTISLTGVAASTSLCVQSANGGGAVAKL